MQSLWHLCDWLGIAPCEEDASGGCLAAVSENTVPFVSASEKVLLEEGLDEEEVQGGAAAAHSDRSSSGGRTKSPRKARQKVDNLPT